jgi:hypothetical protein
MNDRDRVLSSPEPAANPNERPDNDDPGAGTAGGAVGGAVSGAIAGTVIGGPVGTAVGAAIGAVGGAALGYAADRTAGGEIPEDNDSLGTVSPGGVGGVPGAGIGAPAAAPLAGGVGGVGIGATGLPTASSEADDAEIERRGAEKGPYDNPAAYDETAAEVAQDRPILVGDDPGYEAVQTPEDHPKSEHGTRVYIQDRDDIAQNG